MYWNEKQWAHQSSRILPRDKEDQLAVSRGAVQDNLYLPDGVAFLPQTFECPRESVRYSAIYGMCCNCAAALFRSTLPGRRFRQVKIRVSAHAGSQGNRTSVITQVFHSETPVQSKWGRKEQLTRSNLVNLPEAYGLGSLHHLTQADKMNGFVTKSFRTRARLSPSHLSGYRYVAPSARLSKAIGNYTYSQSTKCGIYHTDASDITSGRCHIHGVVRGS